MVRKYSQAENAWNYIPWRVDEEFVQRHTSEFVQFEFIPSLQGRSTNDARFYVYRDYILAHRSIKRVLLTDASDVYFQRNPFELMAHLQDSKLFVGTDIDMFHSMEVIGWLAPRLLSCFGSSSLSPGSDIHAILKLSNVYNAGVLGGHKAMLENVLDRICDVLDSTPPAVNCNMAAVNYVIHRWFDSKVYTGFPLTSRFMRYQQAPRGVYIVHKWDKQ